MSKNITFEVRAHHLNQYPVCLPPWLSDDVLEEMITHVRGMLYNNFRKLRDLDQPSEYIRGHNRNTSMESAGESISSIGTIADEETRNADQVGNSEVV